LRDEIPEVLSKHEPPRYMSGIAGIYYLDGRPVEEEVGRMVDVMKHRGPDGINTWKKNSVGLGHCMLETTPEDTYESLPLVDRDGDLVITADARVDNRDELIEALDIPKPERRPITDTEIILNSYKKWGRECPRHVIGAFSFAIWDAREKTLFCARDYIGVKPLYYHKKVNDGILISSEITPILKIANITRTLNDSRIADQLGYFDEDVKNTYFEGIRRLPPAHTIIAKPDGIRLDKYWSFDPNREIRFASEEEYAEQFRHIFKHAVSSRMRSTTPTGSMLSGGLDSSAIACTAGLLSKNSDSSVHTFSSVYDESSETNETFYIRKVLDKYNFNAETFRGDEYNPLAPTVDSAPKPLEEPQQVPNLHIPWISYKLAKSKGVKVILDGANGDGTVSHGRGFFRELVEDGRWMSFAKEVWAYSRNMGMNPASVARPYFLHFVIGPIISVIPNHERITSALKAVFYDLNAEKNPIERVDLLQEDFAERIGWYERKQRLSCEQGNVKTLRDIHCRNQRSGGKQIVLEVYNRISSLLGVEVRFPFWDRRLVEFCLALPPELKLSSGWNRRIHRLGMDGILPKQVQWRKDKSNMAPEFNKQFVSRNHERLQRLVNNPTYIDQYADMDTLRKCFDSAQRPLQASNTEILHLWNALSLEIWISQIEGT
jgi:asparagine synthase (glutamine-hydrolysing)